MKATDNTRDQRVNELEDLRRQVAKLRQYERIVESVENPVGLVDHKYVYRYVNRPFCEVFNKQREEIIDHPVADLVGQEMFDSILLPQYKRCFAGETVAFQEWYELSGLGLRYLGVRYYPFREEDGRVSAVVINAHDITEMKQLDNKFKESQEKFQAFMENTPAAIYIKDENDVHLYCNEFAAEVVGMKPEEFIGSCTHDLFPPQIADRLVELDHNVLNQNIQRITEVHKTSDKGMGRWFKDIKFPIILESGRKHLGGISFDITEIKQNEQKLQNSYDEISQLKQQLEQENIYLRDEIEIEHSHKSIVGESDPLKYVLYMVEQVAKTNSTVLIFGETGTGKDLVARAIHKASQYGSRTMVRVNCAALPANLIESELFGHEKGAFTGADTRKLGRFEIADGSTLFLDEIGEMPLPLQAKLLRVIEDGTFERVGGTETLIVDVRIIAATNRDIGKGVREGLFREDLWYRLNVYTITVPPLRDRMGDINLLVPFFAKRFCKQLGKPMPKISKGALKTLKRHSWPGNIRELKHAVERALIIWQGGRLQFDKLENVYDQAKTSGMDQDALLKPMVEIERDHILRVLTNTGWKVDGLGGAAEILQLNPSTLRSRMKKLGIRRKN